MKPKTIYLLLSIAGLILPYWQFIPWVAAHGFNLRLLVQQLFANRISGFFALDVIVSSIVLVVFIRREGSRAGVRGRWLPIPALLMVGVSLALPLFLYLRELSFEAEDSVRQSARA